MIGREWERKAGIGRGLEDGTDNERAEREGGRREGWDDAGILNR